MGVIKICFKCGNPKDLETEFYTHPRMKDGHLNKCKECTKTDVSLRTSLVFDVRCSYEKKRQQDPIRRAKRLVYQEAYRSKNPLRYKARMALSNALRDGRIVKQPCKCGSTDRLQAHHVDYSKPLEVEWLCFRCHRQGEHGYRIQGDLDHLSGACT